MSNCVEISVIIPVYNDARGIRATLRSLERQTYPEDDYEIIVVDNGSTDDTARVVEKFQQRRPDLIQLYIEDIIQGSYAARNTGLAHASGSTIIFLDADTTVDADYIESVERTMRRNEWDHMGCDVEVYIPEGTDTLIARYDRRYGLPVERYIEEGFVPTCCLTVRRHVFEEVGPFRDRLISSGDWEFGLRASRAGYDPKFASDLTVYHPARSSLHSLLGKHFRVGRGHQQREWYQTEAADTVDASDVSRYIPTQLFSFWRTNRERGHSRSETLELGFIWYLVNLTRAAGQLYQRHSPPERPPRSAEAATIHEWTTRRNSSSPRRARSTVAAADPNGSDPFKSVETRRMELRRPND